MDRSSATPGFAAYKGATAVTCMTTRTARTLVIIARNHGGEPRNQCSFIYIPHGVALYCVCRIKLKSLAAAQRTLCCTYSALAAAPQPAKQCASFQLEGGLLPVSSAQFT